MQPCQRAPRRTEVVRDVKSELAAHPCEWRRFLSIITLLPRNAEPLCPNAPPGQAGFLPPSSSTCSGPDKPVGSRSSPRLLTRPRGEGSSAVRRVATGIGSGRPSRRRCSQRHPNAAAAEYPALYRESARRERLPNDGPRLAGQTDMAARQRVGRPAAFICQSLRASLCRGSGSQARCLRAMRARKERTPRFGTLRVRWSKLPGAVSRGFPVLGVLDAPRAACVGRVIQGTERIQLAYSGSPPGSAGEASGV